LHIFVKKCIFLSKNACFCQIFIIFLANFEKGQYFFVKNAVF
jgi:hypothetical protein